MLREEIQSIILQTLKEVQGHSGRKWTNLSPGSKPIGALEGFDSLCGVEATVMVEQKLGVQLDVNSLFVTPDGTQALSVAQIASRISNLMATSGAEK